MKSQKVYRRSDGDGDGFVNPANMDTRNHRTQSNNPVVRMLLNKGYTERRLNRVCNKLRLPGKYVGGAATGAMTAPMPSNASNTSKLPNGKAPA